MKHLTKQQDAFGQMLWDAHQGGDVAAIIERSDGLVEPDFGGRVYFTKADTWPAWEKRFVDRARGRVIDLGCGAGRHCLYLQEKGLDVLGIDRSPLAVKVCRARGLRQVRVLWVTELSRRLGTFDTVLMMGNNFGLFGSFRRARWLLRRLRSMTGDAAQILAQVLDPYDTRDPAHLACHRANRRRGRMSGQLRIRVRYRTLATPWFDYLFVSRDEMRRIVDGTGWRVARFVDTGSPIYGAVIEKEATP